MSDSLVHLDAGVVIGWLDADDPHHLEARAAIEAARTSGTTIGLSSVVLAEVLVRSAKAGQSALKLARQAVLSLCGGEPEVVDREIAERCAALRAKHLWMSIPDALIVATAQRARAGRLLTTDKRLARVGGVDLVA